MGEKQYDPLRFENAESKMQFLARSRYLVFKSAEKWQTSQKPCTKILFTQNPDFQKAFCSTHQLRLIFLEKKDKGAAFTSLTK